MRVLSKPLLFLATWRTVQKPKPKRRNNRKKPADVRRPSSHQQNPVSPTKLPKQIRSQTERNAVHRKCKTRPSTILILFSNFTFTLRWRRGRQSAVVAAAATQRTVRRMAKVKCNGKYYMYIIFTLTARCVSWDSDMPAGSDGLSNRLKSSINTREYMNVHCNIGIGVALRLKAMGLTWSPCAAQQRE